MFLNGNLAAAALVLLVSTGISVVQSEFRCNTVGSFLDVHSNCTAYFSCHLANDDDVLVKSRFECPYGQLFSVEEEHCLTASNLMCREMIDGTTVSYQVDTSPTTSTTPSSNNASISTESTTTTSTPMEYTANQTTVANEKINNQPNVEFECHAKGLFAIPSPGCRDYVLCMRTGQTFVEVRYTCDGDGVFSEIEKNCVLPDEYECPHGMTPATEQPSPKIEQTIATEISEQPTTDRPLTTSTSTEPAASVPRDHTSELTESETTDVPTSVTENSDGTTDSEPKMDNLTTATPTVLTTAPSDQSSVPNKTSAYTETQTTEVLTFETKTTVVEPATEVIDETTTTETDRKYENPSDNQTTTDSPTIVTEIAEVTTTSDAPEERTITPTTESTTVTWPAIHPATNSSATNNVTTPVDFACPSNGVFAIKQPGCKDYVICMQTVRGEIAEQRYTCDVGVFSEVEKDCVLTEDYECPYNKSLTTTTTANGTVNGTTENPLNIPPTPSQLTIIPELKTSTNDTAEIPTTETANQTTAQSSTESSQPNNTTELSESDLETSSLRPGCGDSSEHFKCPRTGRFVNEQSDDCSSYYLCLKTPIGQMVFAELNCATGTLFSENSRACEPANRVNCAAQQRR